MKIVLHIGLPRTATTFLQHRVFPSLSAAGHRVAYNPISISNALRAFERGQGNTQAADGVLEAFRIERDAALKEGAELLLISREQIANPYEDRFEAYIQLLATLKQTFAIEKFILVLRFQPDWLLSMYRRAVKGGYRGRYRDFIADKRDADFFDILAALKSFATDDEIDVLYFEQFIADREAFYEQLSGSLSLPRLPHVEDERINSGLRDAEIEFLVRYSWWNPELNDVWRNLKPPRSSMQKYMAKANRYWNMHLLPGVCERLNHKTSTGKPSLSLPELIESYQHRNTGYRAREPLLANLPAKYLAA